MVTAAWCANGGKEKRSTTHKSLLSLCKYLFEFMLASFIGWLYEIVCVWLVFHVYYDRGILHLPLCPIYGFGLFVLTLIFGKVKSPAALFAGSFLLTTAIELAVSYIAEYKFRVILWTYEGWPLNFENRISLISSLIFALMALLFIKGLRPQIDRLFESKAARSVAILTVLLFCFCVFWELRSPPLVI